MAAINSRQDETLSPQETRITRSAMKKAKSIISDSPNQKIDTSTSKHRTRKRKQYESPRSEKSTTMKKTKRKKGIKSVSEKGGDASNDEENVQKDVVNRLSTTKILDDFHNNIKACNVPIMKTSFDSIMNSSTNKHLPHSKTMHDANEFVTPSHSPIAINLSPSRSRKTPRKSPESSTSPKTHSTISMKLSKTPRKLPVINHSSVLDDASPAVTSNTNTLEKMVKTETPDNCMVPQRISTITSSVKKTEKRSSGTLKTFVRKFSKSPKIIIRTPKPKSKKSKNSIPRQKIVKNRPSTSKIVSPKMPSPVKILPINTDTPKKSTKCAPYTETPFSSYAEKVYAAELSGIKSSDKLTPLCVEAILNQPKIILEKLSPSMYTKIASDRSVKSKQSTYTKFSSMTNSDTSLQPMPVLENSTFTKSCNELFVGLNRYTPGDEMKVFDECSRSSLRSRNNRMLKLSPHAASKESPKAASSPFYAQTSRDKRTASTSFGMDSMERIENESEPFICNTFVENTILVNSSSHDSFCGINGKPNNDSHNGNATYELLEPKTPDLRQRFRKRTSVDAELDCNQPSAKRPHKVQFTTPKSNVLLTSSKCTPKSAVLLPRSNKSAQMRASMSAQKLEATRQMHKRQSNTNASTMIPRRRLDSRSNSTVNQKMVFSVNRRSNSLGSTNSPLKRDNHISDSNKSQLSTIEKKLDGNKSKQTSSARKAPNFAQIHKKKFAEMESLIDAKKRVAERHKTLTSKRTVSRIDTEKPKSPKTSGVTNRGYNRFGYKIRKEEAKSIIATKEPLNKKRKEKQEEHRSILKDIRINRRFALQMKSRNINI